MDSLGHNPFGAPLPPQQQQHQQQQQQQHGNPFGGETAQQNPWGIASQPPVGAVQPQQQQQQQQQSHDSSMQMYNTSNQANPFGVPSEQQQPVSYGMPASVPAPVPVPVPAPVPAPQMHYNQNPYANAIYPPAPSQAQQNQFEATTTAAAQPAVPSSYNPFGTVPATTSSSSSAVVVASNQSNPYAIGATAPTPATEYHTQTNPYAIVPVSQHHQQPTNPYAFDTAATMHQQQQQQQQHPTQIVPVNHPPQYQPWGMAQQPQPQYHQHQHQHQQQQPAALGYGLDPFAQQQPPAPAPAPAPASQDDFDLFLQPQQQPAIQQNNTDMQPYVVKEEPPAVPPSDVSATANSNGHANMKDRETDTQIKEAPDVAAPPEGTMYPPQIQYGQRPDVQPDPDRTNHVSPRNPYAPVLAREAPPGASPLPKAELVRKRGFALSRISFRTIVMKKWKQTYWVQYGPHTMLWFRSQADFDDWLNNPYHMQTERNFLIKLAVNFVHDLYKPNVRGYQVTQCRTKGYGNKIVRQFKLERWMDYGPTIAAAFGSYDPVEVDTLREAIVECMRNTPLEGGIRATGAVARQPNNNQNPSTSSRRRQQEDDDNDDDDDDDEDGRRRTANNNQPSGVPKVDTKPKEPESVSEDADLLDVNNWDDVPLEAQQPILSNMTQGSDLSSTFPGTQQHNPYGMPNQQQHMQPPLPSQPQPYHGGQGANPYGVPSQQQQQQQMHQHSYPPSSSQPYSNAIVPATNPSPSYPGAPPLPVQQQQQWMPPTQYQQPQGGYGMQPQHQQQPHYQPQPSSYPQQQQHQISDPWAMTAPPPPIQMQPPQY